MFSQWQRPASAPVPTVWTRFNGLKAMADGRVPAFWVQDVRPEDEDALIAIMENYFLREEEMSRAVRMRDDPAALAEMRALWRRMMATRMALAAWTGWPDGRPRIVACNMTAVACRAEPKMQGATPTTQAVHQALNFLADQVDVFQRFGVDCYLASMGLSVLPQFRGQGLGAELLRARVPLCQAVGVRLTATVFTGVASQKQSERAGFQLLTEQAYADYIEGGGVVFRVYTAPTFQLKALVVPPRH